MPIQEAAFKKVVSTNFEDTDAEIVAITVSVNENITAGDVVRVRVAGSHGFVEKADDTGTGMFGIAMTTGAIAGNIDVLQFGIQSVNFESSITLGDTDVGKDVFVGPSSGRATLTAPTTSGKKVIKLGYLYDTTGKCYVEPQTIVSIS